MWRYLAAMSSTTITTIGALIDDRYRLYVRCEAGAGGTRCNHDALVDLKALAARLGRLLAVEVAVRVGVGRAGTILAMAPA